MFNLSFHNFRFGRTFTFSSIFLIHDFLQQNVSASTKHGYKRNVSSIFMFASFVPIFGPMTNGKQLKSKYGARNLFIEF